MFVSRELCSLQVILSYEDASRSVRLSADDKHLTSVRGLKKLVYKLFPAVESRISCSELGSEGSWRHSTIPKLQVYFEEEEEEDEDSDILSTSDTILASSLRSHIDSEVLKLRIKLQEIAASAVDAHESAHDWHHHRSGGRRPCRYFQRGYCSNRSECTFLHDTPSRSNSVDARSSKPTTHVASLTEGLQGLSVQNSTASERYPRKTIVAPRTFQSFKQPPGYWVMEQLKLSAADNIEQLSSEAGLLAISNFAEQGDVSNDNMRMFVELLAKDEIRTSMLREKTNKVYGMLSSPFLYRLQKCLTTLKQPSGQDMVAFVALIEEIQTRTKDGWKEVPLDALSNVIGNLVEKSHTVSKLKITIDRLMDHRSALHKAESEPLPDECLQGAEFRKMSIVPSREELLAASTSREELPKNRVGIPYSSACDYLGTHFRLLREDFIEPLRQGICDFQQQKSDHAELHVYDHMKLKGIRCMENGVENAVVFEVKSKSQEYDWERRLKSGSLVCMTPDNFDSIFWGVITRRDVKDLMKGEVTIRLIADSGVMLDSREVYVMVESTAAYFEAYQHTLRCLQRVDKDQIPFMRNLLRLEPTVNAPSYMKSRKLLDEYDFSKVFPEIVEQLGRTSFRTRQKWPKWKNTLDESQKDALKHGLTKELAIIQGPPGTGKTYVGLLLVRLLLDNLKWKKYSEKSDALQSLLFRMRRVENSIYSEEYDISGPILIVCKTNHALDQFMEGISVFEPGLIRIGGRSKSRALLERNLKFLLQNQRENHGVERSCYRALREGKSRRTMIETRIDDCIKRWKLKIATRSALQEIASHHQIQDLFKGKMSDSGNVEYWLYEEYFQHSSKADHRSEVPSTESSSELGSDTEIEGMTLGKGQVKLLWKQDEDDDDGNWIEAKRRRNRGSSADNNVEVYPYEPAYEAPTGFIEEFILGDLNVWSLTLEQRKAVHEYWLREIRNKCWVEFQMLSKDYDEACRVVIEATNEIHLSLLRSARVVGMTATKAASYQGLLTSLMPEILIVEEAAEVLEADVLACLQPSVKHLILIGDHLQLRPSVAVDRLAKQYNLDVSMFERLVCGQVEHVTLREQRRMKPCISNLVSTIYPQLQNHKSVNRYADIKGVRTSLMFFDHTSEEEAQGLQFSSKVNVTEAKLVVELCIYLINQDYRPKEIVILSMYSGQLMEIKRTLAQRIQKIEPFSIQGNTQEKSTVGEAEDSHHPRVSSVDDYQGEESEIIILSLVRSNSIETDSGTGTIGFVGTDNRICVALTRARKGLFIFGNASLLAERSKLWRQIISDMRGNGFVDTCLSLNCQNHPNNTTKVTTVEDFKYVEDGGCSIPCEHQLDCGHVCPRRCHNGSHLRIICPKPCPEEHQDCGHQCQKKCHFPHDCTPCEVQVFKVLNPCHHLQRGNCAQDDICENPCEKLLPCGHTCQQSCGNFCTKSCAIVVKKKLPCGHVGSLKCSVDVESYYCTHPCGYPLPNCKHLCGGTCGACNRGASHILCTKVCERKLPCGHLCEAGCSVDCPSCKRPCEKRCVHSRCSARCGEECTPCKEPCVWRCEHYSCKLRCSEICTGPQCDEPCLKLLKCGHACSGLCGEPCSTPCRHCEPDHKLLCRSLKESHISDQYEESHMSGRFVQLYDCGHVFEVPLLDRWMGRRSFLRDSDLVNTAAAVVQLEFCPECRITIWQTYRYSKEVKTKFAEVEAVKKKIFAREMTNIGNSLLKGGPSVTAVSSFCTAVENHPGQMEANFGLGFATIQLKHYKLAIPRFMFMVRLSSFAHELERLTQQHSGDNSNTCDITTYMCSDEWATRAILQWASALTFCKNFTDAITLCNSVLIRDPNNEDARTIQTKARKFKEHIVAYTPPSNAGLSGSCWYTCVYGHFYTIPESEVKSDAASSCYKCPDCIAIRLNARKLKIKEQKSKSLQTLSSVSSKIRSPT